MINAYYTGEKELSCKPKAAYPS